MSSYWILVTYTVPSYQPHPLLNFIMFGILFAKNCGQPGYEAVIFYLELFFWFVFLTLLQV